MEDKEEFKLGEFKPEDYISISYFWKQVLITFLSAIISLIVALGFISYGFNLMSKSSTFYFILGILINAASVVMVFFVFSFQVSKSKTLLRGKKFQEKNK